MLTYCVKQKTACVPGSEAFVMTKWQKCYEMQMCRMWYY